MTDNKRLVVGLLLAALVATRLSRKDDMPIRAPGPELRAAVASLDGVFGGDSVAVANMYAALADVVRRDAGKVISDTYAFSELHRRTIELMGIDFSDDTEAAVSKVLASWLGVNNTENGYENISVDYERLADILDAISWSAR